MGFCAADARDRFALIVGETAVLSDVKYVITLDTDTQLARDSAWQFVGAMAHPLNRARYDEGRAACRCGVRHSSATGGGEPVRHEPVAVCAHVRQ